MSPAEITALAASAPIECAANTTTIGNVAEPGDVTIAPGAAITDLDNFTLIASSGTDTVTAATVTLGPAGAFNNIAQADITDASNVAQCTAITNPGSNTLSFTGCSIPVTTTVTTFKVRITPKTHANMPVVPGASYAVTGTVTAFTSTNAQAGTDSGSATVTVDNLSPSNVTGAGSTPGDTQVTVNWTNPGSDFSNVLVLRNTATIGDVPTEGSSPAVDSTIGSSVVRYIASGTSFIDTGLTNGTPYFYRIFAKDPNGNYAATGVEVSATPTVAGSLIGHWNFNEGSGQTAADGPGTNDGTLGFTASVASDDPAWACSGTALDFDGSDDEVKLSSVNIGDSAAWSISAWIKMSADTADKRTIYGEGNTAQTEYFYLQVAQAGSNVTFYSQNFGATVTTSLDGTTSVEDDAWHLITVVQRSKTDRELYVGTTSEDTSLENAGTLSFNTASIGYLRTDWVADPFKGIIDDVRFYDYALSTGEIATLNASPPAACGAATPAVTSAVAEIVANDVITSSTANSFSYDIQATISGGDTGVNRVAITVPGSFGAPTITGVQVDGSGVAYTNNTSGNAISIDLTTKVTVSSKITVLFDADAPTAEDLTGVDFLATVDDSGTGDAAQSTTEGDGDGDAGDNNSWTVTTTDGGFAVLLVVVDKTTPTAQDAAKKTLIESWGYTVTLIEDTESQAAFDAAVATSDVAYVSEEITSTTLDTKLTNVCIGVVNDEEALADELGIASGNANYTTSTIDITNTSHFITSPFSSGSLTITTSAQSLNIVSGTIAAGAQFLAEQPATANGTLVVIEVGGTLTSPPGGTAAGRRVYLPWGDGTFDINALNTDGKLLMRRAIEWGTAGGACASNNSVTSAVAEISPTDVTTSSTGNSFSYDIQATISGGDTGVDRIAITVPGSFGAPTITGVQVDGSGVAYTNNTSGNAISVDLTTKVTASSKITVLFDSDAPTAQDLTGVDFTSTVDDSGTGGVAAQSTTEGNGDGDAGDANSWTVTTTDAAGGDDVYYSVGTNAADLKTGSPTLSIASGTATLTVAQTGNIGVGDEIDYDTGNTIAYIKSVTSQTEFVVHTATGGVPANVTTVTVNAIRRAFNTIATAEANSGDASHLTTFDLTATGAAANLTWVAYNDALDFTAGATIDGYTTDATHFITLTVADSPQVASGTSQRHNGTAGTGVVLDGQNLVGGVVVSDDYTQFEWFEIIRTGGANGRPAAAAKNATNVIFDHLLIHNYTTGFASYGIKGSDNSSFTVRNCIIYDGESSGIRLDQLTSTGTVQNCTVYGITANGIYQDNGTLTVTNSISMGNSLLDFKGGGTLSYNISSDATGTGSLINKVAADQFVNITAGSENLHLKAGADAIDTGTDLSGSFSDDIDGETRPGGAQWDIGADETNAAAPTPAVTSAVAEISPTDVLTNSTGNSFSYDIQATIGGGDTGVNRVTVTVPGSFGAPTVTDVQVGGVTVAYTDNTIGNAISVDLTTKITASSKITILFDADAPTTQDLTGVDFTSTVDDSGTGDAAQATTEGNGDGDAGDANSWTVTTTDAGAGSLVGHWNFDEGSGQTAADSSGNGNNGTLGTAGGADTNDPAWECVAGSYALNFDGSNDIVDVGSPAVLDDLGPMTLSVWIKPDAAGASALQHVMSKADTGTGRWFVELDNTGEDDALEFNKEYDSSNIFRVTSDSTVTYDVWQHVAITWDGSSTGANIHIYKDGVETSYQSTSN